MHAIEAQRFPSLDLIEGDRNREAKDLDPPKRQDKRND